MSLCFLHALFTFILMLALSGSKEMVLEPSLCPVNSSTIHNCVNTTWNSLQCQDLHGPGTFCVNQTLIQMLCKNQSQSKLIEGPINDSDESFDEMTGPSYPLPASENTLYLVGYSRSLNKSEYSCAASVFDNIEGGFIHRTLLLKRAPVPIKYWDESADKDWCEGTVSDVSSDMELHAADRIDRVKETTTVFYLGEE
ncbi:uncharacterized protein LOC119180142 isoform X6 [Rhipicephalus microplus]|uniref:uncharacterized protein LOC119180142 isoform X6 n=1 Tax=Rhipicephalus microplus TaxID=6941 RepID=UPI003F6A8A54